jgi:group I intron endonuclease
VWGRSLGYKHTEEARLKMVDYYKDKNNHPSPYLSFFRDRGFGKTHTEEALGLISKPGELNPMFGKKHSEATKASMSEKKNKYPLGVGIYDLEDNLILKFNNNVELAKYLGISKVTVGKYLNSGLVYNKTYRFKPIQD